MTRLLALVAVLAFTVVPGASATRASDVRYLGKQYESIHPDLFRSVTKARFHAAVDQTARRAPALTPNRLLVELMRLAALPGDRNGHNGIYPGDHGHRRQLHLYPIRLYELSDGIFVVDETPGTKLRGARLTAIAGVPIERVQELVAPLVPHDNEWSLRGYLPHFALCAEVLDGLGIGRGTGARTFSFDRGDVELDPIDASEYLTAFADPIHGHSPSALPHRARPLYLANNGRPLWLRTLDAGRVVYVGYNSAAEPTYAPAQQLLKLARGPKVRRVVVDVRLNPGGDNTSYGSLLAALRNPAINRKGRLYLLIGRATFSAAGNFATDVDGSTNATLVGEPTGGGVNQYGDATSFTLPTTGYHVFVATSYQQFGAVDDPRLAIEPDVEVPLSSADYFAGRDPVLATAIS